MLENINMWVSFSLLSPCFFSRRVFPSMFGLKPVVTKAVGSGGDGVVGGRSRAK